MRKLFITGLFIALIVLGPGCFTDTDPTSPGTVPEEQLETGIDLDSPTGGLSFADEDPAFGEPDLFDAYDNAVTYDDPYCAHEEIREMERRRGARIFRFRAVWGHLLRAFDDSATTDYCTIDWTGTLHMEGGVIIIEKIIAFEPNDSVRRIDRSTIGWISHTGPRVDGIQVKIVCPPYQPEDSLTNVRPDLAPFLVIRTGPYSARFTLEELRYMQFIRYVDRCGNGISINSHIIQPHCPHGHLMGGWRAVEPDTIMSPDSTETRGVVHGVFRGVWIGQLGHTAGHMRGVYGVNSNGEHVFYGKYIDESGRFIGIMRGNYGPSPAIDAANSYTHGWFEGVWIGKDRLVKGRLNGHWAADRPGFGFFHGVWGMKCSTVM